jgi:hypothetical protein
MLLSRRSGAAFNSTGGSGGGVGGALTGDQQLFLRPLGGWGEANPAKPAGAVEVQWRADNSNWAPANLNGAGLDLVILPDEFLYAPRSQSEIDTMLGYVSMVGSYTDPFLTQQAYTQFLEVTVQNQYGTLYFHRFWETGAFDAIVKPRLDAIKNKGLAPNGTPRLRVLWIDDLGYTWSVYGRAATTLECQRIIALIQQIKNYMGAGYIIMCNCPGYIMHAAFGSSGLNGSAPDIASPSSYVPAGQNDLLGFKSAMDVALIEYPDRNYDGYSSTGRRNYEFPMAQVIRQVHGFPVTSINYGDAVSDVLRDQADDKAQGWSSTMNPINQRVLAWPLLNLTNLCAGKSYTLSNTPNSSFPDTGGNELTNGTFSRTLTAQGVGWQSANLGVSDGQTGFVDIDVDLGSNQSIQSADVATGAQNNGFAATQLQIFTATTLGSWTLHGTTQRAVYDRETIAVRFSQVTARYIRFRVSKNFNAGNGQGTLLVQQVNAYNG